MNIFAKNKDFNDDGIFSIHLFATELDEDTLRTKVNGGGCDGSWPKGSGTAQTSSGGNTGNGSGGAGGNTGNSSSASNGGTTTTSTGNTNTQNPSNPSNPGSGPTGPGYEAPPEVMSNPQAYAYWRAMQALAIEQGDPGKYKDYNVLGYNQKRSERAKDRVYFIYTYEESDKDMKDEERDSINDDIRYLESKGVSVKVIENGTKEDILNAFSDKQTKMIVTSGHGRYDGCICTSDYNILFPSDLEAINISDSLNTVIFENCYQGNYEAQWENALGGKVDVVGWEGITYTSESRRFNESGLFDRQDYNLRDYINNSLFNYGPIRK